MTVQTTEEKLQAERDYSVKARLMAEKDLEMALIEVGRLQAENARLRAALEEIRQQYGQPDVYSTATRIKLIADAALKGGEEGGEAPQPEVKIWKNHILR